MYDEIYQHDQNVEGKPHGWLQWKGTDACIDLHCVCGHHGHMDGDFLYFWECAHCHARYALGQNITLIPLTPEQQAWVEDRHVGFKTDVPERE